MKTKSGIAEFNHNGILYEVQIPSGLPVKKKLEVNGSNLYQLCWLPAGLYEDHTARAILESLYLSEKHLQ